MEPARPEVTITAEGRVAALTLLKDPDLIGRIEQAFAAVGMVGEARNCLVGYLAAVSRMLPQPLAVIVQSTSAVDRIGQWIKPGRDSRTTHRQIRIGRHGESVGSGRPSESLGRHLFEPGNEDRRDYVSSLGVVARGRRASG
jgi:hypothetical protein